MLHDRMTADTERDTELLRLTGDATGLGHEVVEIGAFLHDLDQRCRAQTDTLTAMQAETRRIAQSVGGMASAVARMTTSADDALGGVRRSTALLAESGGASHALASWVRSVHADGTRIEDMLRGVQISNVQISDIAAQITILAVNAKIEAARAGQAGKGFAIVADAVNDLSHRTADAADRISSTLCALADWIAALQGGAELTVQDAEIVLSHSEATDSALTEIESRVDALRSDAHGLADESTRTTDALGALVPAVSEVAGSVGAVAGGVDEASRRCDRLVDTSEAILQSAVALGGNGADGPMIVLVRDTAAQISNAFEAALEQGAITPRELFDTRYLPVPGTDPVQVTTGFSALTDRLLPAIQEPVLARDRRIVFCAAVDLNGYLPTHNRAFSHAQGHDPVWNAAHCRNRRVFDDRVGLKAGRNERAFLLQVYRRDMGGGQFAMMKDASAPIRVQGRHWGGLRLAYRF